MDQAERPEQGLASASSLGRDNLPWVCPPLLLKSQHSHPPRLWESPFSPPSYFVIPRRLLRVGLSLSSVFARPTFFFSGHLFFPF